MGPRRVRVENGELLATLASLTGDHADFHAALAAGHALVDEFESGNAGMDLVRLTIHVRAAELALRSMNGLLAGLDGVLLNRPARRLVRRFRATTPDMWSTLAGLDGRARRLGRPASESRA